MAFCVEIIPFVESFINKRSPWHFRLQSRDSEPNGGTRSVLYSRSSPGSAGPKNGSRLDLECSNNRILLSVLLIHQTVYPFDQKN